MSSLKYSKWQAMVKPHCGDLWSPLPRQKKQRKNAVPGILFKFRNDTVIEIILSFQYVFLNLISGWFRWLLILFLLGIKGPGLPPHCLPTRRMAPPSASIHPVAQTLGSRDGWQCSLPNVHISSAFNSDHFTLSAAQALFPLDTLPLTASFPAHAIFHTNCAHRLSLTFLIPLLSLLFVLHEVTREHFLVGWCLQCQYGHIIPLFNCSKAFKGLGPSVDCQIPLCVIQCCASCCFSSSNPMCTYRILAIILLGCCHLSAFCSSNTD